MTHFFTLPDKDKNYQSYMLYVLCILWTVVTASIVTVGFYYFPKLGSRWMTFIIEALFIALFNLTLNRLGYTRLASWTFTIMLWLYITIPCYSAGGIMAPGISSQISVILTAGFLLGWRGGVAIGLLTIGADFWLAYLEVKGNLPIPTVIHNPITRWIGAIIPFGTIIALQYYATNHLRSSLIALQSEIIKREEADDKIRQSEQLLKKITSQVPGNTYMFEIDESGHSKILFISRGTDAFNHDYQFEELTEKPELLRDVLHDNDKSKFNEVMKEAYQTMTPISFQYRIIVNDSIRWRWMQAVPEKDKNGKVLWYGSTSDITPLVDYIASIEQIIFDMSHVIRRPTSTMLGMTQLIIDSKLNEEELKDASKKLSVISKEMDKFICELILVYNEKRENAQLNIDISSLIDKRSSLFR